MIDLFSNHEDIAHEFDVFDANINDPNPPHLK